MSHLRNWNSQQILKIIHFLLIAQGSVMSLIMFPMLKKEKAYKAPLLSYRSYPHIQTLHPWDSSHCQLLRLFLNKGQGVSEWKWSSSISKCIRQHSLGSNLPQEKCLKQPISPPWREEAGKEQ